MRPLYTAAISLYAAAVQAAAPFHGKARKMIDGRRSIDEVLREKIVPGARYVWLHAASLGEFEQGRPLLEAIRQRHPDCKIVLTFFSPSGYDVRSDYPGADVVCYLPFDFPRRIRAFLDRVRPTLALFVKYEFWLNTLDELRRRRVPTYLVSGIFRPGQLFFRSIGRPYRDALRCFDHLFVQDETSRQLLAGIGLTNVTVTGDTRFDRVIDIRRAARPLPVVAAFAERDARPVLIAGSSWPEDEALLIPYFNAHPDLKLILAPHEIHEAHLAAIEARLTRPALRLSRADADTAAGVDCLIVDSFGLLSSIYRYARIAYIGGGFGHGIHNAPEAAVYAVPVLFGPNHRKFREALDLIACGGAFSITDASTLAARLDALLADPDACTAAGESAGAYIQQHSGATEQILRAIDL